MTNRLAATAAALLTAACLQGCGLIKRGEPCLPQGEKATVLRTGSDGGQRFVTVKRASGEEVTCLGKNDPLYVQPGDQVDGWTMTRARATRPNAD